MEAYQAYYRDPDEDAYRAGVNHLADKLSGREAAAIKIQVIGCRDGGGRVRGVMGEGQGVWKRGGCSQDTGD